MSAIRENAIHTIRTEAAAIAHLEQLLTDDFENAVRYVLGCKGKVIVTGMGKSGQIGKKIAATLASTGTPSFFLHPGEAFHGDLGMVSKEDVIFAISNSGNTDEVLELIPFFEDNGNVIIAMTGNPESTLARHATYHLNIAVDSEACPLSLAPTSSTTASLVMGDALALALMNERHFKEEDFARFHPGGSLGRKLLVRVCDVMRRDNLPIVPPTMRLADVIIAISKARLGIAVVVENERICGLFTDGDMRRTMQKYGNAFFDMPVSDVMTRTPKVISQRARISEAEALMQRYKIHSLPVVDENDKLVGIVEVYDLYAGSAL